jgi:hypothetical protein
MARIVVGSGLNYEYDNEYQHDLEMKTPGSQGEPGDDR